MFPTALLGNKACWATKFGIGRLKLNIYSLLSRTTDGMSYYHEQLRKSLVCRAGDWLRVKRMPRVTAVFILLVAIATAVGCGLRFRSGGMESLGLVLPLSCFVGYFAYLATTGVWLLLTACVESNELAAKNIGGPVTLAAQDSGFDDKIRDAIVDAVSRETHQPANPLGVVVLIGLLGVVFVSIHFVAHAPWYLGELMVNAGKIGHKASPEGAPFDFLYLPFLQSWPAGLFLIINAAGVGFMVEALQ